MRTLIRFLTRTAGGTIETRDRIVDSDVITLGRATDRTLHLKDARVALEHARIFRASGRTLLACKSPAQAIVNGALVRDAELRAGDTVQIGANILRIVQPDEGRDGAFDLAFTFELDANADTLSTVVDRPRLSLQQLGMYKRRWAWGMFIALLSLGLLVPYSGAVRKDGSETLRGLNLPSDRAWLPGPLHASHAVLNERCEACHEKPFVRVRSEACLTCHSPNLHRHTSSRTSAAVATERLACTSCHAEHEEPARLIQTDQRLCANCHGGEAPSPVAALRMVRATDFLLDHPDFMDTRSATHSEGLHFPHDVHLDAQGIKAPDGSVVMKCADCHQPEPGGARMKPIRMEQHCASCHRLDFDPAEPDRTVPHGDPQDVMASLIEYYSARYLAGYPDRFGSTKPGRVVDLPAISIGRNERERVLGLARTRAETVARDLFERRVCTECHDVKRLKGVRGAMWEVAKVSSTEVWMPSARFDHARHGTSLTPCSTCHDAASSKQASDVLMPDIDTCRTCHGGERKTAHSGKLIASTCTSCHGFHIDQHPLWTQEAH